MNRRLYNIIIQSFAILIVVLPVAIKAQSTILEKEIDFHIENTSIPAALEILGEKINFNFSYNSDLISAHNLISVQNSNRRVEEILREIIANPDIHFMVHDKQIILYKKTMSGQGEYGSNKDTKAEPGQNNAIADAGTGSGNVKSTDLKSSIRNSKTSREDKSSRKSGTLGKAAVNTSQPAIDTLKIIHYDTIVHQDTAIIYDTITAFSLPRDRIFNTGNTSVFLDFYPLYFIPDLKARDGENEYLAEVKDAEAPVVFYSFNGGIAIERKSMTFQTGLGITKMGDKFNFESHELVVDSSLNQYTQTTNHYTIDTSDVYYTITGIDTTWIYVLDSTLVETINTITETRYDSSYSNNVYETTNTYTYLEIPLIAGYKLKPNSRLSISAEGGLIAGLLLNAKGKTISHQNYEEAKAFNGNQDFLKIHLSLYLGCGIQYMVNKHIGIRTGASFRRSLNSVYTREYPLIRYYNSAGLRLGLAYYF